MLTADELAAIAADAEATMDSACLLAPPVTTQAADGKPVVSFNWSSATASVCGFAESTSRTKYMSDGVLIEADARLRLPVGTTLYAGYGVRITSHLGDTPTRPTDFVVMTEPAGGVAGVVVDLRRVVT